MNFTLLQGRRVPMTLIDDNKTK